MSLHVERGERYRVHYESLCEAPCEVRIAPGTYRLGVSTDGYTVIPEPEPVVLMAPTRIELSVHLARRQRRRSWTVYTLGLVVGASLVLAGSLPRDVNLPLLVSGGVVSLAGMFALIPVFTARDRAALSLHPL